MNIFLVPREKLRIRDDDPGKKETPSKKKSKAKPSSPLPPLKPQMQEYSFKDFRKLCSNLSQENSYLQKTAIFKEFIDKMLSKGIYVQFNNKN